MTAVDPVPRPEIPYARPYWDTAEEQALLETLRSGMWTAGSRTGRFEDELAHLGGSPAVVVSSGSAALLAVLHVLGERRSGPALLVTPALTFAAAPAAARLLGWDVALCDVEADGLTLDPGDVAEILERTRGRYARTVVMPVHYAGHTADMATLTALCADEDADLVEDACHAAGARYTGTDVPVGSWPGSLAACLSFHPTKPIATAEGGAVLTRSDALLASLRALRNHNMAPVDDAGAPDQGPWPYTVRTPGLNLRLSELHAALGVVQTRRAPEARAERARLAAGYHEAFAGVPNLRIVPGRRREGSAHHLFPVEFDLAALRATKQDVLRGLRAEGIRCQVHYTPLHRLPAFSDVPPELRTALPVVEGVVAGLVSLPLWHGMTGTDQERVVAAVQRTAGRPVRREAVV